MRVYSVNNAAVCKSLLQFIGVIRTAVVCFCVCVCACTYMRAKTCYKKTAASVASWASTLKPLAQGL